MLSCWYFKLASSTNSLAVDQAAISANRSCSCLRCSGFSTLSTISTPVGLPPLPKTLLALAWALVVVGADHVQRGRFFLVPAAAALGYGLMIGNILLANAFPDAAAIPFAAGFVNQPLSRLRPHRQRRLRPRSNR